MTTLAEYVIAHTERGACQCGGCFDAPEDPARLQPNGHTADLFFFKVAKRGEPTSERFTELVRAHRGHYGEVDPFDGKEHSYIEIGGWIGDQGLAMQAMGLGKLLGVWNVLTPNSMPGLPDDLKQQMAGMGMVCIVPLTARTTGETPDDER